MEIELTTATDERLEAIAENMNPLDVAELAASGGFSPIQGLVFARAVSQDCAVAMRDGIPQAAFGCSYVEPGVGSPWMLATTDIRLWRKRFMQYSRLFVSKWRKQYPRLTNYIDVRNVNSIRWLQALGFDMVERIERFGVAQVPFFRFEMNTP